MTHPQSALVPTTDEMVEWIETVCARGIRRPGYDADVWAEGFIADRLREFGLEDVRFEPVVLPRWTPESWSLDVTSSTGTQRMECFPLPHSAPAAKGRLLRHAVKTL